jgi:MYXO-CTERM domain-containing protein
MTMSMPKIRVLVAGAVLAAAGAAHAQSWGANANGNATFFSWANGHNTTGLFGAPTIIGDTFYFFPINFVASASSPIGGNPTQVTATDTFEVDLFVHPGYKFDGISISETGDYSITGPGSVQATAQLATQDLLNPRNASTPAIFNPSFPIASGASTWTGGASEDLASLEGGTPFINIHLSFTNNLISIAGPGGTSVIRKTVVGDGMAVTILPEPGVAAFLGLAGLLAARRRRS